MLRDLDLTKFQIEDLLYGGRQQLIELMFTLDSRFS